MTFKEVLTKIDTLQEQINSFGEIDKEVLKKVHYKFRLDWNYHSNSMEGGTLTREETRSVMTSVLNISNKSIKDLNEMVGHNNIVEEVFSIGKGEKRLSEKRIKEIHRAIIFEEDPDKKLMVGEWKSYNNEIINYKGEKIKFAPFDEVPEKIHTLLNNLNAFFDAYFMGKTTEHPLKMAAQFHIDFLFVHPFHDGNGRVSRILSNLILISCGYPPFIIKTSQKDTYNRLLSDIQMYGGSAVLFYTFIGERIIESQEIILKAIKGEDIEDEDDLEKEIELLKRKQFKKPTKVLKSKEVVLSVLENLFFPILEDVDKKGVKFLDIFKEVNWSYYEQPKPPDYKHNMLPKISNLEEVIKLIVYDLYFKNFNIDSLKIALFLLDFKDDHKSFSMEMAIEIKFEKESFQIFSQAGRQYESTQIGSLLKDVIEIFDKEKKSDIHKSIDRVLINSEYGNSEYKNEIKRCADSIGKDVLEYIKSKT